MGRDTEAGPAELPLVCGSRAEIRFAVSAGGAAFEEISFRLMRTELVRVNQFFRCAQSWTTHEGIHLLPVDQPPPGPNEEVAA